MTNGKGRRGQGEGGRFRAAGSAGFIPHSMDPTPAFQGDVRGPERGR